MTKARGYIVMSRDKREKDDDHNKRRWVTWGEDMAIERDFSHAQQSAVEMRNDYEEDYRFGVFKIVGPYKTDPGLGGAGETGGAVGNTIEKWNVYYRWTDVVGNASKKKEWRVLGLGNPYDTQELAEAEAKRVKAMHPDGSVVFHIHKVLLPAIEEVK